MPIRIKLLIIFLFASVAASAQFQNTDTLRRYIDRFIRNSAIESFTNLRLNTALKGLAQQIDSVSAQVTGGVRVVDTLFKANDSTIAYRIKGQMYQVRSEEHTSELQSH